MQRNALCRSRRELLNAYLLAKFRVDTAENEPCKVCRIPSPCGQHRSRPSRRRRPSSRGTTASPPSASSRPSSPREARLLPTSQQGCFFDPGRVQGEKEAGCRQSKARRARSRLYRRRFLQVSSPFAALYIQMFSEVCQSCR